MKKKLDKKYIFSFLEKHVLSVISSVNKKGLPDAAPVYYVNDRDFNLFFITPEESKKCLNIKHKNEVVVTITDETDSETLRVRGKAHEDPELLQDTLMKLAISLNHDLEYINTIPLLNYKGQKKTVIVVEPYEMRLRRYKEDRLEEETLTF